MRQFFLIVPRNLLHPLPIILGHEGSGIVEKVGSEVKDYKSGD